MVSDETLHKKKKKKKTIPTEDGEGAPKKKKKELDRTNQEEDTQIKKKKKVLKKKKKSLKNSTMLVDPPAPLIDDEPPENLNAFPQEIFGSQSPSPIRSFQEPQYDSPSPPPLTKYSPPASQDNGQVELSDDESEEDEPIPETPTKSPKKVAKKTKIVPLANPQESPKKQDSDDDSEADEMLDDVPPLIKEVPSSPPTPRASKWEAPISDPIISSREQDRRDLLLLTQVKEKFKNNLVGTINWNDLFVYDMTPDEMSERFEVLLKNIPREKPCGTLVSEAMEAFCHSFVRAIPRGERGPVQLLALPSKRQLDKSKKFNAFTLFVSGFDPRVISKLEMKEKWEGLERKEKIKLKKEARLLNNVNGFTKGEKKVVRKMSVYQVFSKEKMNQGLKMTEIGRLWKALTDPEKQEYQLMAESTNRDRKISENEAPALSQD